MRIPVVCERAWSLLIGGVRLQQSGDERLRRWGQVVFGKGDDVPDHLLMNGVNEHFNHHPQVKQGPHNSCPFLDSRRAWR